MIPLPFGAARILKEQNPRREGEGVGLIVLVRRRRNPGLEHEHLRLKLHVEATQDRATTDLHVRSHVKAGGLVLRRSLLSLGA